MLRRTPKALLVPLATIRQQMSANINRLPEVVQLNNFRDRVASDKLDTHITVPSATDPLPTLREAMATHPNIIDADSTKIALDAALATFFLHVESRITSMMGKAFYTIGPCGEELLAPVGLCLRTDDPMALHYRHLSVSIARQLKNGESMEEVMLNRARGYVVATTDPVTGGRHCALGGGKYDFIVTSTLASQTSPAVGRAMGGSLAQMLNVPSTFSKDHVSFVSQGDGSVNNGHFLSAENLAEFASFHNYRVPTVFCVTDNGLSISLKNNGYFRKNFVKKLQIPSYWAQGNDMVSTWIASHNAIEAARKTKKPVGLFITDITRRFGHAATDRQNAYLSAKDIQRMAETNNMIHLCAQAVDAGVITQQALVDRFDELHAQCRVAFEKAHTEPKIENRQIAASHLHAPLVSLPKVEDAPQPVLKTPNCHVATAGATGANAHVMRKHMNKVFDEMLTHHRASVYIGEDVVHGGYYIVSENLAKKHPYRVMDFPPDETSLLGVGMGFAQSGLLPVVEIPYAKYLDCGMDMFTEAAIMNWLSCGKQPNGMVIRLQGFGRGVFGGNYHTHNMLHMPPGVDVICHSNGRNYAKAMRYAIEQAKNGRVIMSVDCTELLNIREVAGQPWEGEFTAVGEHLTFDEVFVHHPVGMRVNTNPKACIVTYGNGMPAALEAQAALHSQDINVDIIECPLLSAVPAGLREVLVHYNKALFADPCKEGQNPLASHLTSLMNDGLLPEKVRSVTAPRTYNSLGNTVTFMNCDDIVNEMKKF